MPYHGSHNLEEQMAGYDLAKHQDWRDLSISGSEAARRMNVGRSAVCRAVKRAEKDEELKAAGGVVPELLQTEISQQ